MASSSQAFPQALEQLLEQTLASRDGSKLATWLESQEVSGHSSSGEAAETLYALQLVAYLITDQLSSSRFLWKRLPKSLKTNSKELKALWQIGQAMWTKNNQQFYKSVEGYAWNKRVRPLVLLLLEHFRQRMEHLIAQAYSSISIRDCSAMLGLSPEQTVTHITNDLHWGYDAAKAFVFPAIAINVKKQVLGWEQLQQLAHYAVTLES